MQCACENSYQALRPLRQHRPAFANYDHSKFDTWLVESVQRLRLKRVPTDDELPWLKCVYQLQQDNIPIDSRKHGYILDPEAQLQRPRKAANELPLYSRLGSICFNAVNAADSVVVTVFGGYHVIHALPSAAERHLLALLESANGIMDYAKSPKSFDYAMSSLSLDFLVVLGITCRVICDAAYGMRMCERR